MSMAHPEIARDGPQRQAFDTTVVDLFDGTGEQRRAQVALMVGAFGHPATIA